MKKIVKEESVLPPALRRKTEVTHERDDPKALFTTGNWNRYSPFQASHTNFHKHNHYPHHIWWGSNASRVQILTLDSPNGNNERAVSASDKRRAYSSVYRSRSLVPEIPRLKPIPQSGFGGVLKKQVLRFLTVVNAGHLWGLPQVAHEPKCVHVTLQNSTATGYQHNISSRQTYHTQA